MMQQKFWQSKLDERPRPRRGVRIERLVDGSAVRYGAKCVCGWDQLAPLRVIVEDAVMLHRDAHRRERAS